MDFFFKSTVKAMRGKTRLDLDYAHDLSKLNENVSKMNLCSIISKDVGSSEDVRSRIVKAQGVFFSQLKKVWKYRKVSLGTEIRIMEATVPTVVNFLRI